MKPLRILHLYLGCIFAPLLLFFTVSGIWQTFSWDSPGRGNGPNLLSYLSTIHTGHGLKAGSIQTLSSPLMKWLVVAMAVSLIFTIVLGIIMAFRFGHRRAATLCLLAGFAVPAGLVALALWK